MKHLLTRNRHYRCDVTNTEEPQFPLFFLEDDDASSGNTDRDLKSQKDLALSAKRKPRRLCPLSRKAEPLTLRGLIAVQRLPQNAPGDTQPGKPTGIRRGHGTFMQCGNLQKTTYANKTTIVPPPDVQYILLLQVVEK